MVQTRKKIPLRAVSAIVALSVVACGQLGPIKTHRFQKLQVEPFSSSGESVRLIENWRVLTQVDSCTLVVTPYVFDGNLRLIWETWPEQTDSCGFGILEQRIEIPPLGQPHEISVYSRNPEQAGDFYTPRTLLQNEEWELGLGTESDTPSIARSTEQTYSFYFLLTVRSKEHKVEFEGKPSEEPIDRLSFFKDRKAEHGPTPSEKPNTTAR